MLVSLLLVYFNDFLQTERFLLKIFSIIISFMIGDISCHVQIFFQLNHVEKFEHEVSV